MTSAVAVVTMATMLASGVATRYAPGVMDTVVENRVQWGDIDMDVEHRGYVALLNGAHVGQQVWLQQGARVDGPYLVADCASTRDRHRLEQAGWAVDLSWELALEWGVVDTPADGFMVWDGDPRVAPLYRPGECRPGWVPVECPHAS